MSIGRGAGICRTCLIVPVLFAGFLAVSGCGGSQEKAAGPTGTAPTDSDEAQRTKAMEDYMKTQNQKK